MEKDRKDAGIRQMSDPEICSRNAMGCCRYPGVSIFSRSVTQVRSFIEQRKVFNVIPHSETQKCETFSRAEVQEQEPGESPVR